MFFLNNNRTFGKDQMQDIKVDNRTKKIQVRGTKEKKRKIKLL